MTSDERYPHLSPTVAEVADMEDEFRLAYIDKDRFIPHPLAEDILGELEQLFRLDDAVRPQGRLLVGHPLMGKTTIITEFLRRHPASDNPEGDAAIVPVVSVQFPEQASEGIYSEILASLNAKLPKSAKPSDIRTTTVALLKSVGMRVLLIDEFHNILEGSASAQRKCLNAVKYLMNALGRPVVAVGTSEVLNAVQSDPQISSRLPPLLLPRFDDDERFQGLLAGFESVLPLRKSSCLYDPDLSTLIYNHTLGIVGDVADLLNSAAKIAIRTGTEQITKNEIDALKEKSRKDPRTLLQQLG